MTMHTNDISGSQSSSKESLAAHSVAAVFNLYRGQKFDEDKITASVLRACESTRLSPPDTSIQDCTSFILSALEVEVVLSKTKAIEINLVSGLYLQEEIFLMRAYKCLVDQTFWATLSVN